MRSQVVVAYNYNLKCSTDNCPYSYFPLKFFMIQSQSCWFDRWKQKMSMSGRWRALAGAGGRCHTVPKGPLYSYLWGYFPDPAFMLNQEPQQYRTRSGTTPAEICRGDLLLRNQSSDKQPWRTCTTKSACRSFRSLRTSTKITADRWVFIRCHGELVVSSRYRDRCWCALVNESPIRQKSTRFLIHSPSSLTDLLRPS